MLVPIKDYFSFKREFQKKFTFLLEEYPLFKYLMYDIFSKKGTAYVVGGFLRDIINNKVSRDLDILLQIPSIDFMAILESLNISYTQNRMKGVKLSFEDFEIDLWCIEDNWSFKNKLVKINEKYIVENIAEGCFYNYDSLVINVNSLELCSKYYNECIKNQQIDILQKNIFYQKNNPTIEGNIIRAIFLKRKFGLSFSKNCHDYLVKRLLYLEDNNVNYLEHLLIVKSRYSKYNELSTDLLIGEINSLLKAHKTLFDIL